MDTELLIRCLRELLKHVERSKGQLSPAELSLISHVVSVVERRFPH